MSIDRARPPPENRVLAALPGAAYQRLRPRLEPVHLAARETIYAPGARVVDSYFPLNAVAAMLRTLPDGGVVGVAIRGNREVIGLPAVFGARLLRFAVVEEVPGDALRVPVDEIRTESTRAAPLRRVLQRAAAAMFLQTALLAACNRRHPADQRLALWLLMVCDRAGTERLPLTQESLSLMLGVRRQTVTEVARTLEDAGAIRSDRSAVTILDRAALERASCVCYHDLEDAYRRLFGRPR